MAQSRVLLATGLLLSIISSAFAAAHLRVDLYKDDASAVAGKAQLAIKGRKLHATDDDSVCYEGCMVAPLDSPGALPLSTLLKSNAGPMSLAECYTEAVSAGVSYFAILDTTECYGGDEAPLGWAPDSCPLDCVEGGSAPYTCGDAGKASVFSMGMCLHVDAPCAPEIQSPPPSPPPSPSKPSLPSPPPPLILPPPPPAVPERPAAPEPPSDNELSPPPPTKSYVCRDRVALYGKSLAEIKLNPTKTTVQNLATCKNTCTQNPGCQGFYYKTTGWCYLVSQVFAYGKEYSTAVQACRVPRS